VFSADGRLSHDLRASKVVWKREMIRFLRNRGQIAMSLVQPVAYLLILGTGLSALMPSSGPHADYRTYLFPGVLVMTVQGPALAAGISIVWDREVGFLREMLVAPVSRAALLTGKCLGGATVATCQGLLVLSLAGAVGIPYHPGLLAILFAEMSLAALTMTALGALIAVTVTRVQTFQTVISLSMMPMTFLSGAVFPLAGLPGWLTALSMFNPLRYTVHPLNAAVADRLRATAPAPGGSLTGWQPPAALELAITAVLGLAALILAARRFARTD
jgi:ABC-2 type transport system permease protein